MIMHDVNNGINSQLEITYNPLYKHMWKIKSCTNVDVRHDTNNVISIIQKIFLIFSQSHHHGHQFIYNIYYQQDSKDWISILISYKTSVTQIVAK
jgi:hypothetical protein